MSGEKPTLIVITGPTASGKSALALRLAREMDTEIISADSRQIYRDIPISTAQPTAEEQARVKHHLVGILPPEEYYSAAMFEQDALRIANGLFRQGKAAIVCGGSMLYIDALCNGIDPLPTVSDAVRTELKAEHARLGDEWLLSELKAVDPLTYDRIDRKNMKRVFHAVEVSREAGRPYSSLLTGGRQERPFRILKFAITRERDELFARINSRAAAMLDAGLLDEARRVWPLRELNSMNTVGLKEMFAHLEGRMTLDEALARMQKNTRVYAKKQLTWLKRDDTVRWVSEDFRF